METEQVHKEYFNDPQLYSLAMNTRDEVIVAGRGMGKGAIQAGRLMTNFQGMPGSMGGFVSPSVKRCLTNILPSMLIHLERWGFKRDLHYVVGKRPWKALHWKSPIFTPANWENTISFYNGSVCNIISQDRAGTSNSMSLDYIIIDEAKFINFEQLKDETFQANRGNEQYFHNFPLHHGMTITSDMPVTKKGSWFLSYKDDMDKELVEAIEGLVYAKWRAKRQQKAMPSQADAIQQKIDRIDAKLSFLRSKCLLYKEYTSIQNLALLGEEFIRRAKRDLPPLTFATSIMCKRIEISTDGFYGGMREDVNLYTAPNETVLNLEALNDGAIPNDCRQDSDLDAQLPLIIAFDANANINWLVCGQVGKDGKLRVLKSFFVKYERKIPELLDDFNDYYRYHRRRKVVFYYDATFVGNSYGTHSEAFYRMIITGLRRKGWNVKSKYIGKPMNHILKNDLINRMFRGRARHLVLINRDNNPDLLISITSAGVKNGQKDKSGEKLAETEEDKLESRTDGSDAFDTLCIGVERFPVMQYRSVSTNGYSK
ncbi:hypothetical protein PRBRB14_02420 [Hallella multisaccharivorax DSM 17128]|uniref:Uncharacterized protein n=1 Tax=Hallella multisaccharivorax DSM 17128 TaxID=688246 RepID=F8NB51_9BACT|nr:hypothetical protein [Hallella multisaccharivorax]EGN55869.1 hypothetical protein Premu_0387 [Hallella multisaccharivorax DSM 17128]GJG29363.1 hypothetical protein PRBRB14_02420 [Hallella multisaccharivorax DSM 17128]